MILYFTGTGNSLSIAKVLAEILNDEAIHIKDAEKIDTDHEKMIGLVYPCYFGDIPNAVKDSINKLSFDSAEYIFGITVHGGDPGNCLYTLHDMLKEKGSGLSYGEEILTPVNSRIMYGRVTTDIDNRVKEVRITVKKIAQEIENRKKNTDNIRKKLLVSIVSDLSNSRLVRKLMTKKVDEERCIKCYTCEEVCSLNNIKVTENGVHIGNNCTDCLACVHWCPKAAIGFGNRKVRKEQQYHHPDVSLKDMILE